MDFGRREAPSAPYVRYVVKKVKETGIDKPKREKPKTVRTPENIAAVAESVCEASSTSIYLRSQHSIEHFGDIIVTNFSKKTLVRRHTKFNWFRS